MCMRVYVLKDRRPGEGFEASLNNSVPFLTSSHWALSQAWRGMCVSVSACVCVYVNQRQMPAVD